MSCGRFRDKLFRQGCLHYFLSPYLSKKSSLLLIGRLRQTSAWFSTNKRNLDASGLYASVEINGSVFFDCWIKVKACLERLFPKHHTLNIPVNNFFFDNSFLTKKAKIVFIIRRPTNKTVRDTNERENMASCPFCSENCLNGQETTKRSDWP